MQAMPPPAQPATAPAGTAQSLPDAWKPAARPRSDQEPRHDACSHCGEQGKVFPDRDGKEALCMNCLVPWGRLQDARAIARSKRGTPAVKAERQRLLAIAEANYADRKA